MNGFLLGGALDGFTRGLIASRGLMLDDAERERQARKDALGEQMHREEMDLKRQEIEQRKADSEANRLNEASRIDLARQGLGLDREKVQADTAYKNAGLGLDRERLAADTAYKTAGLGLEREKTAQAAANMAADNARLSQAERREQEKFDFEKAQRAKLEARQNLGLVSAQLDSGAFNQQGYDTLKTALGYDPGEFFLNGKADAVLKTVEGVRAGQIKPDDPQVGQALDGVFGDYLRRGVGEKLPDGAEITGKRYVGLVPAHDKPGYFGIELEVQAQKDGKPYTYRAPLTTKGSADPNDQAVLLHGDELEKPFAVMLGLNANQRFKEALKNLQSGGAVTDPKQAAEIDKIKAQTEEARAKAGAAKATAESGGKASGHESKMDDVRSMAREEFGGKYDGFGNMVEGGNRDAWAATLEEADRLLRDNPKMTATQAYSAAAKGYRAAQAEPEPAAGATEKPAYNGPRPWLR